jgi:ATPases involved in chromosome partitioning
MAQVLAVVNQKGGVGKTTTSVNLAAYLASFRTPVAVIDLDPQANATAGLGVTVGENDPTVYEVLLEETTATKALKPTKHEALNVIPATPDLVGAAIELLDQPQREYRLQKALKALDEHFSFILIDCPPSLGMLTVNALTAAERVLVPVQCEYYALEGLNQLMHTVDMVRKHLNPDLQVLGALLTMYDRRVKLSREVMKDVRRNFPGHVFDSVIPAT